MADGEVALYHLSNTSAQRLVRTFYPTSPKHNSWKPSSAPFRPHSSYPLQPARAFLDRSPTVERSSPLPLFSAEPFQSDTLRPEFLWAHRRVAQAEMPSAWAVAACRLDPSSLKPFALNPSRSCLKGGANWEAISLGVCCLPADPFVSKPPSKPYRTPGRAAPAGRRSA